MEAPTRRIIRFNAYLPADVHEKLQRLAEEEDRSMSAVLRCAIEDRAATQGTAA